MKKLFIILVLALTAGIVNAQKITVANYTDTLSGAQTKTYLVTSQLTYKYVWCAQVYMDHITGASDSTNIWFEGSIDGTTWYKVDPGTPTVSGGCSYYTGPKVVQMGTTDGSAMYFPQTYITYPYMRLKAQHWATGTARIKAYIYIKR